MKRFNTRALHLALGTHPFSSPIARASNETARDVEHWAQLRKGKAPVPKRQDASRIETERFRNDAEAA